MELNLKKYARFLPVILILLGIILRVAQYLYNRSLTEGEAPLAMNIIMRSYFDLLRPLDYVQSAPIGFLFIEKFFVNILGNNEYTLRLFPLLSGILASFFFYQVLKHLNDFRICILALSFFVINDHLIYFSSEVKPYSSDVLFGLLLFLLAIKTLRSNSECRDIIVLGITGIITTWFSFPSLFIFIGSGLILIYRTVKSRNYRALVIIIILTLVWASNLLLNYLMCLRYYTTQRELLDFWHSAFIPLPPKSLKEFYQIIYAFLRIFKNPGGFSIYEILLAALSFFIGVASLWNNKREYCFIFLIPLFITILASSFRLYPFEGRVLLFINASIILFVSAGLSRLYEILKKESKIIAILVVLLLFLHPLTISGFHLIKPRAPEELRPVLEYVNKNKRGDDIIYVYYGAVNAYKYYQKKFPRLGDDYIPGIESRDDWTGYYRDIERLKGKRVWFLFSHIATHLGANEEKIFLSYLNILGTKIDSFSASGASAYLYYLNR
uniref:Glycosyltransferase RgtA/B/C/D-like domain-containing protein n=1 Tax=candidate division WOR-3 bacterium TaxID=2052148 RepID=A0A7V3RHF0_UNCW3